jgi:hypothetical protein
LQELSARKLRYEEALGAYDLMAPPDDMYEAAPLEELDVCSNDPDF